MHTGIRGGPITRAGADSAGRGLVTPADEHRGDEQSVNAQNESEAERDEREEFVVEACYLMRDRFRAQEVWERLDFDVERCLDYVEKSEMIPTVARTYPIKLAELAPDGTTLAFVAPAGTTTALVGSSGSGKSTLISLVMAFNRPIRGRVLVDGRDLADVKLIDYREQLASVLQDNFLFDGTIAENVGYAKPGATLEEITQACRIAHCDEFIERFPDGYQTVVGERGIKLSGGQRQRVSIARAILADPRILILDEATSSLDSESEQMIQDGLRCLRSGRTTFVIAHRLSTIRSADQILVMEGGEIVERGTHDALLAANGRYRQLYDKQYKFEMDRFINPGEDFTPEPEKPAAPLPRVGTAL